MSATGRKRAQIDLVPGTGHERHPDDFYATPAWATRAIIRALWGRGTGPAAVLDPAAGDGAILDVVRAELPHAATRAIEVDEGRARACVRKHDTTFDDALTVEWPVASAVLCNPPFKLAMEFVERALEQREDDTIAFPLRLSWLAGIKRAAFHRAAPADVYVLPRRPSFTPDGGTDSAEYAWFVWAPGRGGRWFVLDVEKRNELPASAGVEAIG